MTENFKPKCLLTDRVPACTATGHIVPCCWVDNPMGWKDPTIAKFYDKSMHLDNNDSINDIVNSDTWYEWFNMLRYHPEQAPNVCKKYCSLPVNEWITRKVERND